MRLRDRPRHFLPPSRLRLARLAFRYSYLYDVYVPRVGGNDRGPMLAPDRRRSPDRRQGYTGIRGPERRVIWDRRRPLPA